jgi:DNA-damage-inducible protein J
MATSTKVTFRMDENTKEQFEAVLNDLGMNITTGINVLARAVIRHGGFPFELSQSYKNPYNLERIEHSRKQSAAGNVVVKTEEELGLDNEDEN